MQEYRMIEEVIYVLGDRVKAPRLIEALCLSGASIEDVCERLIMLAGTGDRVIDFADLVEDTESIPDKRDDKNGWRDAARYARERERAQAQAYHLMMKHHKAREVARFKRQKRIYGGLL